jgi:hypothetical protein
MRYLCDLWTKSEVISTKQNGLQWKIMSGHASQTNISLRIYSYNSMAKQLSKALLTYPFSALIFR